MNRLVDMMMDRLERTHLLERDGPSRGYVQSTGLVDLHSDTVARDALILRSMDRSGFPFDGEVTAIARGEYEEAP